LVAVNVPLKLTGPDKRLPLKKYVPEHCVAVSNVPAICPVSSTVLWSTVNELPEISALLPSFWVSVLSVSWRHIHGG